MRELRRWTLAALWLALGLSACGGGGSGGPGGDSPPPVLLSADVYPIATGDRRSFRTTAGSSVGLLRSERVGAIATVDGRSVWLVMADDGNGEYIERTAAGVFTSPGPGADAYEAAIGRTEILRFGIAVGQTVNLADKTVSADMDGDGRADSVDLRVDSSFIGNETIDTAAGRFASASHVRATIRFTIRLANGGSALAVNLTVDEWYAPGIGLVRSTTATTGTGVPASSDSEDLIAYGVGALHSESVAPTLASVQPADGTALAPQSTWTLNFSEMLDPLTLDGIGVTGPNGQALPTTRTVSNDGLRIQLQPRAALADGAYLLRIAATVTDLANNPIAARTLAYRVDTAGPRLAASVPANAAAEAPVTGTLVLRFDEPIFAPPGAAVGMLVTPLTGIGAPFTVAAEVVGNELRAALTVPLLRNTSYAIEPVNALFDGAGNQAALARVSFRTDPGPLGRPQVLVNGSEILALTQGDINGDGRRDVVFIGQVIGTSRAYLGARLQQPDGRYAAATELYTLSIYGCDPRGVGVGDVDGDGRADVVLASGCGLPRTDLLLQRADGSFAAAGVTLPAMAAVYAPLALADIDGDGRAELVVAIDPDLHVLRFAAGSWTTLRRVPMGGSTATQIALADLDGDGRLDLAWLRTPDNTFNFEIAWAMGTGTGTSASAGFGPTRARTLPGTADNWPKLALGDVTGDGRPDLVVSSSLAGNGSSSGAQIAVLAQQDGGNFGAAVVTPVTYNAASVAIGDMDGDGRRDVVVGHSASQRVGVLLQAADGSLQAERLFESAYAYYDNANVLLADLDADGRLDVIAGSSVLAGRPFNGVWPLMAGGSTATSRRLDGMPAVAAPTVLRSRGWLTRRLPLPAAAAAPR